MKKIKLDFEYRYAPDGNEVISIGPGEAEIHDEFYDRAMKIQKQRAATKKAAKRKGGGNGPELTK